MNQIFDTPLITTDQSIDRVLNAGLPVLLVFFTGQISTAMKSELDETARANAGKLLVVQAEMKDSSKAAARFGVFSAPAIVAYRDGQSQGKDENVSAQEIPAFAAFLLGKAPRPQPRAQPAASTSSGYAAGDARPGSSSTGHPQPVTDASFEQEVMRSPLPVLVDFWAPWCGPCRMTNPILEKLSGEMAGRLKIAKVNVDENPAVAGRYGVQAIPTMMLVKEGKIVDRWAGALPEPMLRSRLSGVIHAGSR